MALTLDKVLIAGGSTVSVGQVVFSNSNGMSIGLSNNTMTFAYSVPSDYISSNQSSLFQQTSLMSNYQQTSLMSNYLNTSVSSQFQQTSGMSAYQQTSLMSNYLNTSVSSEFQQTSLMTNYLNTSVSSEFQQTSLMTNYLNTSVSSEFQQTSAMSAYQQTSQMSNYLGTTASLDDLADVVISSATLNQVLKYNGANWVNGDNIAIGAGNGVVMFFDETPSGIGGYDTIAPTPDTNPEVDEYVTVNNNTVLIHGYSTTTGIGRTVIDAGVWDFNVYTYVSNTTPTSTLVFEVYKRTVGGTETLLFSAESDPIIFTSIDVMNFSSVQPSFIVNDTDYLVVKVYGKTTALVNIDVHFLHSGTQHYSHVHTPLYQIHNDLAGLQGGAANEYYHLNSADYSNRNISATSVYQLTANMSNYLNTSVSSEFQQTSLMSNYLNTSVSSEFQQTSLMSNYLNTSVSSQFQQTSGMSAYQQTSLMSNYLNTSVSSEFQQTSLMSNYAGTSINVYATGNTVNSSSSSQVLSSLLFKGAGAVSVGVTNGSIVVSALANTGIVVEAGTSTQKLDTLSFLDGNGVTFGLNVSTISASVETAYAASTHTHGNPTLFLTNISGSTASASNGLTLSLSAANPGGAGTYVALTYNNRQLGASTNSVPGQNSVWLVPMVVGESVYASTGLHMVSLTGSVTSNQTNTVGYTWEGALYKVTGTNASRYDTVYSTSLGFTFWNSGTASVSYSYNVTSGSSAGSNLMTASVYGLRQLTFNIGSTLSPGDYAWGFRQSSSSAGNSSVLRSFNAVMDNPLPVAQGFLGSATNASIGYVEAGTYSVTSGAMPASFLIGDIRQTLNAVPYIKLGAV